MLLPILLVHELFVPLVDGDTFALNNIVGWIAILGALRWVMALLFTSLANEVWR